MFLIAKQLLIIFLSKFYVIIQLYEVLMVNRFLLIVIFYLVVFSQTHDLFGKEENFIFAYNILDKQIDPTLRIPRVKQLLNESGVYQP